MPVAMAVHAARLLRKCQTVRIIFNLNICCGDDSLVIWAGGVSVYLFFGKSKLHLFQVDAVQNQEMLQKAYEAANRVKVIFAQLGAIALFWDYR